MLSRIISMRNLLLGHSRRIHGLQIIRVAIEMNHPKIMYK